MSSRFCYKKSFVVRVADQQKLELRVDYEFNSACKKENMNIELKLNFSFSMDC